MCHPETRSNIALVPARFHFPSWLMAALLALATTALYWPVTQCNFVNYDDDLYVTGNPHIQCGMSWRGVKWAFLNPVASNWHPLTVLSHMLDCQLFGLNSWGHHLTNVLVHAVNTALVFLLLRGLTGTFWRSLFVAALFGFHPVHVESVAWVAERKDVLSTFFGLLALIFYAGYAQKRSRIEGRGSRPNTAVPTLDSRPLALDYSLALLFFAMGLMSKPMLVTWPFVMLLLDYWPLGRGSRVEGRGPGARRLVAEKIPFFALAAMMSVVTCMVQNRTNTLAMIEYLSWGARSENALISYCRYLGKLFWPADLAVFYPHPGHWPMERVLLAGGLIAGITMLFIVERRRYPFLLMGWLWYCGTLVPVIGLVQAGDQAMADRYAYVPSLGIFIMTIWGVYELTRRWRQQEPALLVAGCLVIVLCFGIMRQQLEYWKDSRTLFGHALAVTDNNYLAHNNLGNVLNEKGQIDDAISQFQEAIRLKPNYVKAHNNLGTAFLKKGRFDLAISQFQKALQLNPDFVYARNNLATACDRKGQTDEAIRLYREAIQLKPDYAEAHYNLGTVLLRTDQLTEAIDQFQDAIRLKPNYADAYNNLGIALGMKGQLNEAISQFQEAIRLEPDYVEVRLNLAHVVDMKNAATNR